MSTKIYAYGEIFANLRKSLGLSQSDFADKIGVSRGSVQNWEQGKNPPPMDVANILVKSLGVSAHWLLTGEGPMFSPAGSTDPDAAAEEDAIPVFESACAGQDGRFSDDVPAYYLPRPHGVTEKPLFAVQIQGESMEPVYKSGDVVFVTPDRTPATGQHVVVVVNWNADHPELLLKIWQRLSPEKAVLLSINPAFRAIEIEMSRVLKAFKVVAHIWSRNIANARIDKE